MYTAYQTDLFANVYIQHRAAMINFSIDGSHEVDYLLMEYTCRGAEYTFPGFEDAGSPPEGYAYTITIEDLNPRENHRYFNLDPYRTDRAIRITGGSLNPGQIIEYTFGINGRDYEHDFLVGLNVEEWTWRGV